jgi:membrane protein
MGSKAAIKLINQTVSSWMADKAPRLGAALAYYAIFSIPPLVVLVIASTSFFYHGDVSSVILRQIGTLTGEDTAKIIMDISKQQSSGGAGLTRLVGVFLLLFGASGVFGELQDAMNTIWEVKPKEGRGFMGVVKDRFFSFTMVLGIAFLLLVSMMLTSFVSMIGSAFSAWIPAAAVIGHILELAVSFGVVTLLFALMFKILPDVKIGWNDVWIGAAATAALFTIGKFAIGLYLTRGGVASPYGAAGSVVLMIAWVYYSSQILFLGAEFTKVYTNRHKSEVKPTENAEPVMPEERANQGLKPNAA